MRILFDSNVIISAFAAKGLCRALFDRSLERHDLCVCEEILSEISDKLRTRIHLPQAEVSDLLSLIREHAIIVIPEFVSPDLCRDPDDLMALGAALSAQADYLVTGDADLLVLESLQGIPIVTPRALWTRMEATSVR